MFDQFPICSTSRFLYLCVLFTLCGFVCMSNYVCYVYVLIVLPHRLYSVVEFATREDMLRAVDKYDGYEINGKKIRLIDVRSPS